MEKLLTERNGQQVEIMCGAVCLIGKIVEVKNGVLRLEDERDTSFIAVKHITSFKDVSDNKQPVGFGAIRSKS